MVSALPEAKKKSVIKANFGFPAGIQICKDSLYITKFILVILYKTKFIPILFNITPYYKILSRTINYYSNTINYYSSTTNYISVNPKQLQ